MLLIGRTAWEISFNQSEVTHHQCGISTIVSQTSFDGETSGSVAKCQLLSQAYLECLLFLNKIFNINFGKGIKKEKENIEYTKILKNVKLGKN